MSAWAWRDVFFAALTLSIVAALTLLAARVTQPIQIDVSRAVPHALSERLDKISAPIEVVAYARDDVQLRSAITRYFGRFERVQLRMVNPDADPEAARALNLQVNGEMRVRLGERQVRLAQLDDQAFARALDQLTRKTERVIGVLELNERPPRHERFLSVLSADGARVLRLDLQQSGIPSNLSMLLLLGSQRLLNAGESFELQRYLEAHGSALWLVDPTILAPDALIAREPFSAGLGELATLLGLRVMPGSVVDQSGAQASLSDPTMLQVTPERVNLSPRLAGPVVMPGAAALEFVSKPRWTVERLLESTKGPDGSAARALALGFTQDQKLRVVVVGDQDFLSDNYIGMGSNRLLGERLIDALDPHGATMLAAVEPVDARLKLDRSGALLLSAWLLLILPGLLVLLGIIVRRRAR